ncbi:MAG: four helix bundle protein [Bacteroidales bacterium]|nr:four helix bundle protein [Bacteroidales bacterium]MCF8397697.1 four helix bundle protein [Bacteroidales bacterium]
MSQINSFRDLIVFQKAYEVSMEIFEITKEFPKEEKYSLTDQIRRSSRSVTSNIAEAWAKRIYVKSFVSKLSDSLGEEYESEVWLDYSRDCHYINLETYNSLINKYDEVRKMLIAMINSPEKFCK